MRRGDAVLFYHSGDEKRVVGLARVRRAAYPDPTAAGGDWSCVDLESVRALDQPVTLAQIRADKRLAGVSLLKQSRLSVMPLTKAEFERILALADTGA